MKAFVKRVKNATTSVAFVAAAAVVMSTVGHAEAGNSATIVAGSLTQGTVRASLTGGTYAQEGNDLGDWPLDTGGFGGTVFPIAPTNPNFNANAFGGNADTMIAFGDGGGVTLQFDQAIKPVIGEKEFGLFTAQAFLVGVGSLFNGNMEAAILVSGDGSSWVTLDGLTVTEPTSYTATSHKLNAPTVAYDFGNAQQAWSYGSPGTSQANLDALAVADFLAAMPDDDLFNGSGTDADRNTFAGDATASAYDAVFGDTGGGNWFDISLSGLDRVSFVRLNGVNVPSFGGVRLDAVFTTEAAIIIPEPASLALLTVAGASLVLIRRRASH